MSRRHQEYRLLEIVPVQVPVQVLWRSWDRLAPFPLAGCHKDAEPATAVPLLDVVVCLCIFILMNMQFDRIHSFCVFLRFVSVALVWLSVQSNH